MERLDEEGFGYGYGYGYGEEGDGPIIEQTSSSPSHYEIMALVRLLATGLGVTDSEGEEPYLRQVQSHSAAESRRIRSPAGGSSNGTRGARRERAAIHAGRGSTHAAGL